MGKEKDGHLLFEMSVFFGATPISGGNRKGYNVNRSTISLRESE